MYKFYQRVIMKKIVLIFTSLLAFATSSFAFIGSDTVDLVFTPVTPCRILDTRPSQGGLGSIAANGTNSYQVGIASHAAIGGSATNCGLTAGLDMTAIAVNFTVVSPTSGGFITAFPFLATRPTAATVNFATGDIVGNSAIIKLGQSSGSPAYSIYSTSGTDVVADVVGYFSKPVSVGSFVCEDTTPVTATINETPFNSLYYGFATASACSAGFTQVALRCYTNNAIASAHEYVSGSCAANSPINTHTLYASRRCCRIPGR
jgi:hypothetical protein